MKKWNGWGPEDALSTPLAPEVVQILNTYFGGLQPYPDATLNQDLLSFSLGSHQVYQTREVPMLESFINVDDYRTQNRHYKFSIRLTPAA